MTLNIKKYEGRITSQRDRRTVRRKIAGVALGLAAVLFAVSCGSGDRSPDSSLNNRVVTTIYPVTYFAGRVGGDAVEIVRLVPAGVEAHDFEPSAGDIRTVSDAALVIYTHPSFEVWIDKLEKAVNGDVRFVKTAELGQSLDGAAAGNAADGGQAPGPVDPHVWLDPLRAAGQVQRIAGALSAFDPENSGGYIQRANELIRELERLDARYKGQLAVCNFDLIVVSHEAYGHMVKAYGLTQVGLSGLAPEFESSPAGVAEIVRLVRDSGIRYILQEPLADERLAATVAAETGVRLLELHPLESLTRDEQARGDDYFTVMERNLAALVTALDCTL